MFVMSNDYVYFKSLFEGFNDNNFVFVSFIVRLAD